MERQKSKSASDRLNKMKTKWEKLKQIHLIEIKGFSKVQIALQNLTKLKY